MSLFITGTLKGQLGNQMFIVQAVVGLARKHGVPWALPITMNDPNSPLPFYMLQEWKQNYGQFFYEEIEKGNGMLLRADYRTDRTYMEQAFEHHAIPYLGGTLRLDGNRAGANGNYSSFKYANGHDEYISKLFGFTSRAVTLSNVIPSVAEGAVEECRDGNACPHHSSNVAIHVRRGDYLNLSEHLTVLPLQYYINAIKYFIERGYTTFNIYSDDIEWCKSNITSTLIFPERGDELRSNREGLVHPQQAGANTAPHPNFTYSTHHTALQDMHDMAHCLHHIIANSTYSMWAAYLNKNPNKIVVCPPPNEYFGPAKKHLNTSTLFPDEWVRVAW